MSVRWTLAAFACLAGSASLEPLAAKQHSVEKEGRYFVYDTTKLDWAGAASFCRERQSQLAFPRTAAEMATLSELLSAHGIARIHAGVHDLFAEGDYHTANGGVVSERCSTQWAAGFPAGGSANNCGSFTADGLADTPCSEKNPLVCEENITWLGYELIRGLGYYKYYNDADLLWTEAVQRCQDDGAHLLVVNSELEWTALKVKFDFETVWVGVNRLLRDDLFLTTTDTYLSDVGFATWAPGEPSGGSADKPFVCARAAEGLVTRAADGRSFSICEREQFRASKL